MNQAGPAPAPGSAWKNHKVGIIIGVVLVLVLLVLVIGTLTESHTPPYVSQLQSDGYSVQYQNGDASGVLVGYAYGSNAAGEGELVVQASSASEADIFEPKFEELDPNVVASANGDLIIVKDTSYSDLVSSLGSYAL